MGSGWMMINKLWSWRQHWEGDFLVLTTMFISVSNQLPKTSYIKMMDVWLLFNLFLPFTEVLLHTYKDYLRSDERDVNHHGSVRTVGGDETEKSEEEETKT